MRLIRSPRQMSEFSTRLQRQDKRIGVVPTMGALHDGHASLIRAAAAENDVVIVTIFVNPLQFGPNEDFRRYPRTFARDCRLARAAGADVIFAPNVRQLYPPGFQASVDIGALAQRFEGALRPGHFQGVATVVTILFELTHPTTAYFGQKDYQQSLIVRRLIEDLHLPLRLRILPTIREADGLAMSSRNAYLSSRERTEATVLYRALRAAKTRLRAGARRAEPVIRDMRRIIHEVPSVRIDYLAIVDANTLTPQRRLHGRIVVLVAVRVGRTRLIDNLLVDVS